MSAISVLLLAATLFMLKTQKTFHDRLRQYEQENKELKERSLLYSPSGLQIAYIEHKFIMNISEIDNNDYVHLIVAQGENKRQVFSGNYQIGFFEWLSDDTIAVYKNCGTECMIAYRIELPTLQTHRFYFGSGYTWSPNGKYVFASLSVPQHVITVADAFGTSLFTLRREPLVISNTSVPHKALWSPDSSKLAILIGKESKEKLELIIFDVENNFSLLSRHDIDPSSFRDFFWRDYQNVIYREGDDENVIRV